MTPMPVQVGYRVAGPVAWLTLDSPHNRNALSRALVTGLMNRLTAAASDPAVRVVVVRAAGPSGRVASAWSRPATWP
jgi:enoyl-CoA hydratase/carnithine racemase